MVLALRCLAIGFASPLPGQHNGSHFHRCHPALAWGRARLGDPHVTCCQLAGSAAAAGNTSFVIGMSLHKLSCSAENAVLTECDQVGSNLGQGPCTLTQLVQ